MGRLSDQTRIYTNHNVYILGAGFSADARIPLLNNFLYEMRASLNWLQEQNRETERRAAVNVLTFRKEAASAALRVNLNVENIEDLFSLAAASSGSPYADEETVSTAIAATIDYSRRTAKECVLEVVVDEDFKRPSNWQVKDSGTNSSRYVVPCYDAYCGFLSGKVCESTPYMRNTVISFNYDTMLEDSLANWNVPVWYGFDSASVMYDRTSSFSKSRTDEAFPVLKLHGSVNWAKPLVGEDEMTIFGSYGNLIHSNRTPVLVPPTWRKNFEGALNQVWNRAVEAIEQATRIVIIGFSIPPTDIHIKFLLAAGLQENISLRNIYCMNPDPRVEQHLYEIIRPELKLQSVTDFKAMATRDIILRNDIPPLLVRPLSSKFRI